MWLRAEIAQDLNAAAKVDHDMAAVKAFAASDTGILASAEVVSGGVYLVVVMTVTSGNSPCQKTNRVAVWELLDACTISGRESLHIR
ncbi:hypothetical protein [Nonomuraea sp. NPDC002799]